MYFARASHNSNNDVRAYAQITAISECLRILQQGIIDKQNREEMAKSEKL